MGAMWRAKYDMPPDAYAIKTAAEEIVLLAEPLELYDIIDRARILVVRLTPRTGENLDLDESETRDHVLERIVLIEEAIAEIVYACKRQGLRTTENEITRVAVNFIVHDYQANGKDSLLVRVLLALNA